MTDILLQLVGKKVSLFDTSGDCLDINLSPIKNWWDEKMTNTFVLTSAQNKYIFLQDTITGFRGKAKISDITDITGNDIEIRV